MDESTDKPLRNIGVAITRPVGQSSKLSQLIQKDGGHVITYPLIDIAPLDDYSQFESIIDKIVEYDWILFISSNAVQNSMPRILAKGIPSHLKFAAIGPTTAHTLNDYGIHDVLIPSGNRFDSESLLSLPEMLDMKGKKVLLVRGIGGRDVLANTLTERGAKVTFAECYQRVNPQTNSDVLAQAYRDGQLHALVVTSSEAMRFLLSMTGEAEWLKHVVLYVNHERVAEEAMKTGLAVKVADAPGDEAMLASLKELKYFSREQI
ncbi:MAG TPA: uroporphyrinogen-III synthase [Methylophilaceae bacterium]|nr:uroporphyrinogen-III synthase [Methylophilaceae bacterium]